MTTSVAPAPPTALPPASASRGLHRWALVTVAAMFPLIWMGGLVTTKGVGMSVPDWPNTFGYNMFAVPWGLWLGATALDNGVFYEHTHRLLGSLVGFLAIITAVWAWRHEPRKGVRRLAYGLLALICVQGILGGMRVVMNAVDFAIVHGITAQITLCTGGLLVLVTSRWWTRTTPELADGPVIPRRVATLATVATAAVVLQLIVAATMRHYGAGLAVPDFPLHYGQVVPPTDSAGLAEANAMRATEPALVPTTLGQIWLHVAHRIGAVVVTLAIAAAVWVVWKDAPRKLGRNAGLLVGLLVVQVTLGILTVLWRKPADVATAHVAVGALLLLTSFVLAVRSARLAGWIQPRPAWRESRQTVRPTLTVSPAT